MAAAHAVYSFARRSGALCPSFKFVIVREIKWNCCLSDSGNLNEIAQKKEYSSTTIRTLLSSTALTTTNPLLLSNIDH